MSRILAIALVTAALSAQGPPPPPPPDGPKQAVSGRVLDSATGRPVRGARVAISQRRNDLASVYSDFDGRFAIDEAPVGEWSITAAKSGYMADYLNLIVPAAQPLKGVELRIHPQAVITGRVVDHRGRPVARARVTAYARAASQDGDVAYQALSGGRSQYDGLTDDRGEYRLWNLRPSEYAVAAFPEQEPSTSGVLRYGSTAAIYPNAPSLSDAEQVRVDWGQVRDGIDLELGAPAETRVEGRVAVPGQEGPCESCVCILFADDPDGLVQIGHVQMSGRNSFTVEGLAPGAYLAHLRAFDRATGSQWSAIERFRLSAGRVETIEATLSGEVPITGRLVLEDPPDDLRRPWRSGVRLMPPAKERRLGMFTRGMFANLQVDGGEAAFELSAFPGAMRLDQMSGPDSYIAGVSVGGRPIESNLLEIPPGGLPGELLVRVRFDTGTLEGTVEDPDPPDLGPGLRAPGYRIQITPVGGEDGFSARRRTTGARGDGAFQQRLPPGIYDVVAMSPNPNSIGPGGVALQEAPAKYRKRVEIRPGETTRVQLEIAPAL